MTGRSRPKSGKKAEPWKTGISWTSEVQLRRRKTKEGPKESMAYTEVNESDDQERLSDLIGPYCDTYGI